MSKLFEIEFVERIDFGRDCIFVFQARQHALPPFVVCDTQLLNDVGVIGDDVFSFARVMLQIKEFLIVDQCESLIANRAACILRIGSLSLATIGRCALREFDLTHSARGFLRSGKRLRPSTCCFRSSLN